MKTIQKFIALVLLLGWTGVSFADVSTQNACPPGQILKKVGNLKTGSTVFGENPTPAGQLVTSEGVEVRRIIGRCGGTACVVAVIDGTVSASAAVSNYVIEVGAAASSMIDVDFSSTPLQFKTGITVHESPGNAQSLTFYSCQQE